jgi:manganese/zinc/iron transport system permease protein
MALLGVIQNMQSGHAAGLESFIYGKTASMGYQDISLITWAAIISITTCLIFFKELKLLCFDDEFAVSRGYPVLALDVLLMSMVVLITIVGLQAVGLVLMIALLVIPAAASRFWTERLWTMFVISGIIGALSSMSGAGISALFAKLPSGPMIVLFCTFCFLTSMILGTEKGLLGKTLRRIQLNRSIDRQHLLRGLYEIVESTIPTQQKLDENAKIPFADLLALRSWSKSRLLSAIERAQSDRLIDYDGVVLNLSKRGVAEAKRLTHQHRLWELYLITYAELAPGRVDREADNIEHVLEPEIILELEDLLKSETPDIISSPHKIEVSGNNDDSSASVKLLLSPATSQGEN